MPRRSDAAPRNDENYAIIITMRVGIDARLWDETGIGRYIRNLVKYLQEVDQANEYVLFVLGKDYGNVKALISNKKWKVVIADVRWHSFAEQIKLSGILYKEKLDLMHFPYYSYPILYSGKFVATIHDLILLHFPTGKASNLPHVFYKAKLFAYKLLTRNAVLHAQQIIAVSNATKQEIVDHYHIPKDKITVTYEGVDERMDGQQNKLVDTRYKILHTKYFLYVGNAYPHKNLERLIQAFGIFKKDNGSDVKLILVGKNNYFYKRLEKTIDAYSLRSDILVFHDVNDEALGYLYKNAIATVIPSLMEGFGLPALEAMSQKCLVVASDIPSIREICGITRYTLT